MSVAENTSIMGEARDTERAIALWRERGEGSRGVPPLTAFDFSNISGELGYRFVISCDEVVEDATFLLYGTQFARRLGLPDKPDSFFPMLQQLPERYRPLFIEGCSEAIHEQQPARFSGSVPADDAVELYRAVFIPVKLWESSPRPLIYGSFNFRRVQPEDVATVRQFTGQTSGELGAHFSR